MKNKLIKSGFKIVSRCCQRGYTYKFEIYQGACFGEKQGRSSNNEAVKRVVLDLCQPLTDQGFVVAFEVLTGYLRVFPSWTSSARTV